MLLVRVSHHLTGPNRFCRRYCPPGGFQSRFDGRRRLGHFKLRSHQSKSRAIVDRRPDRTTHGRWPQSRVTSVLSVQIPNQRRRLWQAHSRLIIQVRHTPPDQLLSCCGDCEKANKETKWDVIRCSIKFSNHK